MFGISDKTFDLIVKTLAEFAEIEKAGVYGSRAVGNFKNGSDIDLVLFGDNISEDTLLKLKTRLEQELPIPYYFDVTHYEKISNPGLKKHIDEVGIVFYSGYNHKFPQ